MSGNHSIELLIKKFYHKPSLFRHIALLISAFLCTFYMNTLRIAFRAKFLLCNDYFSRNRFKLAKCRKSHILQSARATYFQVSLNIIQLINLKVLFCVFSIHIYFTIFFRKLFYFGVSCSQINAFYFMKVFSIFRLQFKLLIKKN